MQVQDFDPAPTPFTLHWSRVQRTGLPAGHCLLALWPAPVNADACFAAAGFTVFGDQDEAWEREADALLTRLLNWLAQFGPPRLLSVPLRPARRWWQWTEHEPLPLREQIQWPQERDELPPCVLAFGDSPVRLQTSCGHHLYWLTVPDAPTLAVHMQQLAGPHPRQETPLDWSAMAACQPE